MTDTTTEAVDKVADLIERLEYGVCPSGIHEDNQTELFLVDDANDTMAEAAATIRTLATRIEQLERELAAEIENNKGEFESRTEAERKVRALTGQLAAEKALADRLEAQLKIAEAALSDIGDAEREDGDDLRWCEQRAAKAIPGTRAELFTYRKARGL